MKKIKLVSLILFVALMIVCFSACTENKTNIPADKFAIEGVFLKGRDSSFIITDDNSPIILEGKDESTVKALAAFGNGDRIKAYVGEIEETYPARTALYEVELLKKGSAENINGEVLNGLKESGWID